MSTKLTGNGRWESSRILLPEHREQYLARHNKRSSSLEPPTLAEMALMKDVAILPMILTILDRNKSQIERTSQTLRNFYIRVSDVLSTVIQRDIAEAKRALRLANVYLREGDRVDGMAHYRYNCRGYEDSFAMTRDYVRTEISARVDRYIAEILVDER